jgi:hypothetical protein
MTQTSGHFTRLIQLALVAVALVMPIFGATTVVVKTQVSPAGQTNATEPSVAVDRSDGTVYVAWQASGSHVARSDDGGRTWTQLPSSGADNGDVDVRVGGPTPCSMLTATCTPGTHRVYLTTIESTPLELQTKLAYSDNRGASWTLNNLAAFNPSFVDRPWIAVYPSTTSANQDQVYVAYHDFSVSQINVAASNDGGQTFGPSIDVLAENGLAFANSFCNTVPSGIEVDPETGEVYVEWITSTPVANTTQGCNLSQVQPFNEVWVAHSAPATGTGAMAMTSWLNDAHLIFDGGPNLNTDDIFASLAVDDSGNPGVHGNVYAAFSANIIESIFNIRFMRSSDKAVNWGGSYQANGDPGTHFFPWMAAGSTGSVDMIWLNTPDSAPTDGAGSQWFATFAQVTNALSAPSFSQTNVSGSTMHVGGICTNGLFCISPTANGSGNRGLADSISVAIDRGGGAALVWTDQGSVLHGPTHITYACVTGPQSAIAGANAALSCKGPTGP